MTAYPKINYRRGFVSRLPWLTLGLAAVAWTLYFSTTLTTTLQFDRAAVADGQLWRFFTAHLTHFGADHLRWDLLAFVALGTMAERISRRGYALTLGFASFTVSAGVWLWLPQFETFRGLSGIDSALFGFVIVDLLVKGLRARHGFSIVVACVGLVGFAAKCAFEVRTGSTVFVDTAGDTVSEKTVSAEFLTGESSGSKSAGVPMAHLMGMIAGAMMGASGCGCRCGRDWCRKVAMDRRAVRE